MLVIDTSAWIEVLSDGPLRSQLVEMIPAANEIIVPTIVQLELAKWLTRERGEDSADEIIAYTETCVVAVLDTKTAILAAELCANQKLPTADAVIYATALRQKARLLTCDAHFKGLDHVDFLEKIRR